jgi:hypothetical protein
MKIISLIRINRSPKDLILEYKWTEVLIHKVRRFSQKKIFMESITFVSLFQISFQIFLQNIMQRFFRHKIKSYVSKKKFSNKQRDFPQPINTQQNQKLTINLV